MTLVNAAWAIDGALMSSALARRETYTATSAANGITSPGDLKVTALDTPGVGVQISAGGGVVLNRYQATPSESYVVSNPSVHIVPSGDMPGSNPSPQSYILAIVIGDPEFSQVGHPFMGVDDPPVGEEATFEYVRAVLVPVAAAATTIAGAAYPYLALARIDIPASTTTITNAMIVDLRKVARPMTDRTTVRAIGPGSVQTLTAADPGVVFPSTATWSVEVPSWATHADIIANLEGVRMEGTPNSFTGVALVRLGTVDIANLNINEDADVYRGLTLGGEAAIPLAMRGTTQTLSMRAYRSAGSTGNMQVSSTATAFVQLVFSSRAV